MSVNMRGHGRCRYRTHVSIEARPGVAVHIQVSAHKPTIYSILAYYYNAQINIRVEM